MTQNNQEFATPEAALEHYGVKGMQWGVRKAQDSATSVKRSKPTNTEIHDARANQASKQREINRQIDKTNLSTGKAQEKNAKKLSDMAYDMLKDPDRATALRLTTGEKVALGILNVGFGGVVIPVTAVAVGTRYAKRKSIEKQQKDLGVKR